MQYPFKNLVFEGGGVKGIAYVGALRKLEERNILGNIERVGGTSAGAINAVLVALGYTIEETQDVLWKLDFNEFMDDSWGYARDARRVLKEYGWHKGDFFRDWMGKVVKKKTGNPHSTFHDLAKDDKFHDLYLVGTNLSTGFSEVFSCEHTARMLMPPFLRRAQPMPVFSRTLRKSRYHRSRSARGVLGRAPHSPQ